MCNCIYFGDFHRLEEEEEYQEDPEDPDFEEEKEEDFVEGKSYLPWSFWTHGLQTHPIEPVLNTYIACLFWNTV